MKVRGMLAVLALGVVAASASAQAPAAKQDPAKPAMTKADSGKKMDTKATKSKTAMKKPADTKGQAKGMEKKDTTKAATKKP